jgi:LuxR family maltose regulon positive regulatory protein
MIDQGLQNKAIAERLYISEATVKWHLQRLFAKLEVKSRSAAVARVRAVKNANYGAM